ncbi:MAG: FkbM family methyltransferase [Cryomorphaceae bacterium]|jgi:hypothetical protein|nr:FkbM family methyltransferase [Cryomorphaceae bacterium]
MKKIIKWFFLKMGSVPENVSVTTLDHFCSENHMNDIDILKIDTQRSELQILEGATQLLKAHKIKMIYLEIIVQPTYETKSSLVTIHQHLTSNGFELINFYNQSFTKNLKLRQFDAIYLLKK